MTQCDPGPFLHMAGESWAPSGKERPGLLLPQSPDDTHSNRRRPADIYVPALAGSPAALDFAVTAPQRRETLAAAGLQTGAAAAAYARHKEQHLNTARACEAHGVVFVPMVLESTGTWDSGAAIVIKHVARAVAARGGEEPQHLHAALLQELCVVARLPRPGRLEAAHGSQRQLAASAAYRHLFPKKSHALRGCHLAISWTSAHTQCPRGLRQ